MIGSDNIRKGPDRTWQPRGVGHAVTFRCWRCDKPRSTQGAKLVGRLRMKVCAECANAADKPAIRADGGAMTMDEMYGDGSDHEACQECGMCRHCGDCKCAPA